MLCAEKMLQVLVREFAGPSVDSMHGGYGHNEGFGYVFPQVCNAGKLSAGNALEMRFHEVSEQQEDWKRHMPALLSSIEDEHKARPFFEANLSICEAVLGESHSKSATAAHNLGVHVYKSLGYPAAETALQHLRRALALRTENESANHPDLATTQYEIACVYMEQAAANAKPWSACRPLLEASLATRVEIYTERHPLCAEILHRIGLAETETLLHHEREGLDRAASGEEETLDWEALDADGDGQVSISEIMRGFGVSEQKAQILMLRFDEDRSGTLELNELSEKAKKTILKAKDESALWDSALAAVGKALTLREELRSEGGGVGNLQIAESRQLMGEILATRGQVGELGDAQIREMFEKADADTSGELELEEIAKIMVDADFKGMKLVAGTEQLWEELGDFMASVDKDVSGAVDFKEFSQVRTAPVALVATPLAAPVAAPAAAPGTDAFPVPAVAARFLALRT